MISPSFLYPIFFLGRCIGVHVILHIELFSGGLFKRLVPGQHGPQREDAIPEEISRRLAVDDPARMGIHPARPLHAHHLTDEIILVIGWRERDMLFSGPVGHSTAFWTLQEL